MNEKQAYIYPVKSLVIWNQIHISSFLIYFLIKGSFLYTVVLVFAIQQRESAISFKKSIFSQF